VIRLVGLALDEPVVEPVTLARAARRAHPDQVTRNGNGEKQERADQNAQNRASGSSLSGTIVGNLLSHL
jgi:hypothetical protein